MTETELRRPDIVPPNIYDMDETGIILSILGSTKILIDKNNRRDYKDARVKRLIITTTTIEKLMR